METSNHLLEYFCVFLKKELRNCNYIELPSIHILSQHFGCTYMFFYDVLRQLDASGYDYSFSSLDGALQVWGKK